jgi:hypothetical protein
MSVLIWPFLLVLDIAAVVLAPVLVLLALPAVREDGNNVLPPWLQWLNTPDDRGSSQGLYEPQVMSVYKRFGFYAKTWYWLGVRNTFGGLWDALARPGLPTYSSGESVQTKGPYRAGIWLGRSAVAWELDIVWPYSATKCGNIRLGWRVHDGSGTFLFQPRVLPITRDSTT